MRIPRTLVVVVLVASCRFDLPAGMRVDAGDDASVDGGGDAEPMAWLHPWAHRKAITLLASQIEAPGSGALVDFPVLVSVTDPQIGASALATAEDIVFTASDGATVFPSEIESFSPANGQLV